MQLMESGLARQASARPAPPSASDVSRHGRHSVRSGKRHHYDLVSSPVLGTGIWVGGGLVGLLLVIIVVAFSLRR